MAKPIAPADVLIGRNSARALTPGELQSLKQEYRRLYTENRFGGDHYKPQLVHRMKWLEAAIEVETEYRKLFGS